MKNAKRGSGSFRVVSIGAVAGFAVTLALAACGGGGSPSASVSPDPAASATASSGMTSVAGTAASTSTSTATASSTPPTMHSSSVMLNWMPPTENTNGSVLTNLAGYEIHYGPQSDEYTNTIKVDNPGIATYEIDNLSPGTYYFVVTAYNADGTQSPVSSEVRAVVD